MLKGQRMPVTTAKSVPAGFEKYYRVGNTQEFVDAELTSLEAVTVLEELISQLLSAKGIKFQGWAFAREPYLNRLAEFELGTLVITREGKKARRLMDIDLVAGTFNYITPDLIEDFLSE